MAPNSRKKCSSLVAQSLSTSLITSNPSPRIHQLRNPKPPIPSRTKMSLPTTTSNHSPTEPSLPAPQHPVPLHSTPLPPQMSRPNTTSISSPSTAILQPPTSDPFPLDNCTSANLHTVQLAHLHTCTRAHVRQFGVYVHNGGLRQQQCSSTQNQKILPSSSPTTNTHPNLSTTPANPAQPAKVCTVFLCRERMFFSYRSRCNPTQDLFDGSSLYVFGGNCTHAPPPALPQPSPSPPRNP